MFEWINTAAMEKAFETFRDQKPFSHCIIKDFFKPNIAEKLVKEFPNHNQELWHQYNNAIEVKKTCNNWNVFPKTTYRAFEFLNSEAFLQYLSKLSGISPLHADPGLNGGGWHSHAAGGKLNPHLDYSIHPKLGEQRKINLLVYLNPNWQADWGGKLGLWKQDPETKRPGELVKEVVPEFNQAVLFDTTQNSWHGITEPVKAPDGQCRQSMAIYYLTPAPQDADPRGKALFSPTKDQENDQEILELIQKRSQIGSASSVYRK